LYVRASTVAKHYQRRYERAGQMVYVLSPIAVALVAAGTLWPFTARIAFALELVLLGTILFVVRRAHRLHTHANWIESRVLVERVRHAMVLAACGVEAATIEAVPHLSGIGPREDWVTQSFRESWRSMPALVSYSDENCRSLARFAYSAWVTPQRAYHERTAARARRRSRLLERAGIGVFVLAMVAAATHLLLLFIGENSSTFFESGLILVALVLPAVGAALGGYRAHREYSKLARRSANMAARLEELGPRYDTVANLATLESLLRQTEQWMLHETHDWLALMDTARLEAVG
jgi:hypothetical protein